MNHRLTQWNTARIMRGMVRDSVQYSYLKYYGAVNKEMTELYQSCYDYITAHHGFRSTSYSNRDLYDDVVDYFDKLKDFQDADPSDPVMLGHKAEALFGNRGIKEAKCYDPIWVERMRAVVEYASQIDNFMKYVDEPHDQLVKPEFVAELNIYLDAKGLSLYKVDESLLLEES